MLEHVECPVQELRALHATLRDGGRVVIGIKNEGVELWRGWKADNRDNHLWCAPAPSHTAQPLQRHHALAHRRRARPRQGAPLREIQIMT